MENSTLLCPVAATLSVIGGKWKPILLWNIRQQPCHFSEFLRRIPPLSQKVLTQHLRQMEQDGLVSRTVLDESPVRVMYALTEYGKTLLPLLGKIAEWGETYQVRLEAERITPSHPIHTKPSTGDYSGAASALT